MRKEEILATLRKALELAMIVTGIGSAAVQLANGGARASGGSSAR